MLATFVMRLVDLSTRHAVVTLAFALLLGSAAGIFAERHFIIRTDTTSLLSSDLAWKRRLAAYSQAFPERGLTAVVSAPTPELADAAARDLASALQSRKDQFVSVARLETGDFFARNALLFLSPAALKDLDRRLLGARGFIGVVAADPSLRGVADALSLVLAGVESGRLPLASTIAPLKHAAEAIDNVLAGRPSSFSWQNLATASDPDHRQVLRFIEIKPVLDFSKLEPGRSASQTISQIASDLLLNTRYDAEVRQTGSVAVNDSEYSTITSNLTRNGLIASGAAALILWLALRSLRLSLAVGITVGVGLALSTAAGLLIVGALNLISIAFFTLFIGLSVDFAIQFTVRYRAERYECPDLQGALSRAAAKAGRPLALAACATALGFFSFLPTAYRGLAELGQIAGVGMLIAFLSSITLLPALLFILKPAQEAKPIGFGFLAPVDHFLMRHRIAIVGITFLLVVVAAPALRSLHFDFNPLHLLNPRSSAVTTYLELQKEPEIGANAIDVIVPNLRSADALGKRLSELPEVRETKTLSSFVPQQQKMKLELIHMAASELRQSLDPPKIEPKPNDRDVVASLSQAAALLSKVAMSNAGKGAEAARRLSTAVTRLAAASPAMREKASTVFVDPLLLSLAQLRSGLRAAQVSIDSLPNELVRQWITAPGEARVEVLPKGDPGDSATISRFAVAVLKAAPNAAGPAIFLYEAARTVLLSFIEAAILALTAIAALLFLALRRLRDVLLTLLPLMVAGLATLELCALLGLVLNFANIIALPLLLGVGVAFKIYYVEAWRSGRTDLLQTSLTRAIFFSGLTTASAFGTLWLSQNPGMSSMGELMALALACTLVAAILFQPALMGPPRSSSTK